MTTVNQEKEGQFLTINRYETEENAVFINYEHTQLLQKIQNFKLLKYQERLSLSKNILTIRQSLKEGPEFFDLLEKISNDHEQLQRELLDQFQCIVKQGAGELQKQIVNYRQFLVKPLVNLIKGTHSEIKEQACDLVVKVINQYKHTESYKEQNQKILQLAIQLAHSQNQENKIVSIQLLGKIISPLQKQSIQSTFKDQYKRLYDESTVRVKRQVITHLNDIAQCCSQNFLEQQILQGFFFRSCKQTAWGIRKDCVEILSPLIILCKKDSKKEELIHILLHFLKDGNKIVRVAAHKAIPKIIANYGSKHVPEKLVQIYLKLPTHQINHSASRPHEVTAQIAFYFPGVLYTLGKVRWPDLKKLFEKLIKFKEQDIKRPIACGLHQIAKIIGPEASKQAIFQALDLILKEHSDKIKLSAIAHLSEFVELFDKVTQQNLIDVFLVLQKDPKKWRIRHSIAHQLCRLSKIYEPEINFKYIIPIALKLCNDNVSEVRDQAAKQMFGLIYNLGAEPDYQIMTIESVKGFGFSEKYIQRQTFAKMFENVFEFEFESDKYSQSILQIGQNLANDPVILVRISLAISVGVIVNRKPHQISRLKKIIEILIIQDQVSEYLEQVKLSLQSQGMLFQKKDTINKEIIKHQQPQNKEQQDTEQNRTNFEEKTLIPSQQLTQSLTSQPINTVDLQLISSPTQQLSKESSYDNQEKHILQKDQAQVEYNLSMPSEQQNIRDKSMDLTELQDLRQESQEEKEISYTKKSETEQESRQKQQGLLQNQKNDKICQVQGQNLIQTDKNGN